MEFVWFIIIAAIIGCLGIAFLSKDRQRRRDALGALFRPTIPPPGRPFGNRPPVGPWGVWYTNDWVNSQIARGQQQSARQARRKQARQRRRERKHR